MVRTSSRQVVFGLGLALACQVQSYASDVTAAPPETASQGLRASDAGAREAELIEPGPVDPEATREAARTLGREGFEAFSRGDYPVALDKLERAYRVVKAPTVALWSARVLEKVGKLLEAATRLLETTQLEVPQTFPELQAQAKLDAAEEYRALLARLPSLRVDAESTEVEVTVDGSLVPPPLWGVPRPINPGPHLVIARRGPIEAKRQLALAEGEHQTVHLMLTPKAHAPLRKRASTGRPKQAAPRGEEHRKESSSKLFLPTWVGWATVGIGATGVAVGIFAGIACEHQRNTPEFTESCRDNRCPPNLRAEVDDYNRLRTVSSIGLVFGAVGLGTGTTLLLIAPPPQRAQTRVGQAPALQPWIGVASAGIHGHF